MRVAIAGAALLAAAAALACGSSAPRPAETAARQCCEDSVVVLVPGATGSMLRDRDDGRVIWGFGRHLVRPHDGGYALAHPITSGDSSLEPFGVLEQIRLAGVVRKPVYGPLLRRLEAIGYRRGDLRRPRPDETLFPFAWDWRLSHVAAAARLDEALAGAWRARGQRPLRVSLLCQSSGAHVCRWFAKYGGASLEQVEAGGGRPPAGVTVARLILVGSSNGGSLRILRELDRGRRYLPVIGRKWQPETLFTFPSLYEDLPAYRGDLFVGGGGEALDVDLYDSASWTRYGWSAFGASSRRRLLRLAASGRQQEGMRGAAFGTEKERIDYLRTALDRARRFQRALRSEPPGFRAPSVHFIQGREDPATPERAVLVEEGEGEWRLLFTGDREVDTSPLLRDLTSTLGDGHATLASQAWLGAQETQALAGAPVYVPGEHFELILSREASAAIAAALEESSE